MSFLRSIIIGIGLLFCVDAFAGQPYLNGGTITYCHLGGDTFLIRCELVGSCAFNYFDNAIDIKYNSTCGNFTINAPIINSSGDEISQLCPSDLSGSECSNGFLPGHKKYIYEQTVYLLPCNDWVISTQLDSRVSSKNLVGLDSLYIEAKMDNSVQSYSSMVFKEGNDVPFFYDDSQQMEQNNALEISECFNNCNTPIDSVYYSLIPSRRNATSSTSYVNPYSATEPISNFTINNNTGRMSFITSEPGFFFVTILVDMYDSSNTWIGSVMREQSITVWLSSSNLPPIDQGLSNTLNATQVNSSTIRACNGNTFCVDISVSDPNTSDVVSLSGDFTNTMPGATFTQTPGNPAVGTLCWEPYQCCFKEIEFNIKAYDDACPGYGADIFTYTLQLDTGISLGQDVSICKGDSTLLGSCGESVVTWSVLSGEAIDLGNNFSCNPCASPYASPTQTTTYTATGNNTNGCSTKDTITVTILSDPEPVINGPSSVEENVSEYFYVNQTSGSTYFWSVGGGTIITGQNTDSILVEWGTTGNYTLCVSETNIAGCTGDTCIQVNVTEASSGINTYAQKLDVKIVPNPSNGKYQLMLNNLRQQEVMVTVTDVSGKILFTSNHTISGKPAIEMDMSDYNTGVYFIKIVNGNNYSTDIVQLIK